jgi:hypothetical protein
MTALQTRSGPIRDRLAQFKKYLPLALAVAAFATVGAAPALARHHHYHHPIHRILNSYYQPSNDPGEVHSSPERDAALRECNTQAQKYSNSAWETTQFAVYGTCMSEHGQIP